MFNKKFVVPTVPTQYPSGVCVQADGNYYYINGQLRHPIIGARILESWKFPRIIKTSEKALTNYLRGARLGFRDGSLIKDIETSKIYFISKRLRRPVHNPDFLTTLGLTLKDAVWVSSDEIALHELGEVLK